jgi:hypothetical protein
MKNADEGIERVLAALREAEAPEGMEQRILEAMQNRASARREWRPLGFVMPSWPVRKQPWVIAMASLAVVSLAICWTAFRGHRSEHNVVGSKRQVAPADAPAPAAQAVAAREIQPLPGRSSAQLRGKADFKRARVASNADTVTLHEMLAVSYPAPPMPLTEQEKLLLRIAHRRDAVELAMLEPMLRIVQEAEEKEEFQRFFGSAASQSATEPTTPSTTEQTTPEQPAMEQPTSTQPTPAKPTTGENE